MINAYMYIFRYHVVFSKVARFARQEASLSEEEMAEKVWPSPPRTGKKSSSKRKRQKLSKRQCSLTGGLRTHQAANAGTGGSNGDSGTSTPAGEFSI